MGVKKMTITYHNRKALGVGHLLGKRPSLDDEVEHFVNTEEFIPHGNSQTKNSDNEKYCPYRVGCVSKVTPNCITNYQRCMAYIFYKKWGVDWNANKDLKGGMTK